ncbi:elongation factor Ts [Candidatus Saccharibacteria bacterium]|nr:elongation factor Ts [Candidatus Saccharibacteria bacterium]
MSGNFTIDDIKKLREMTGVGLTDAKKALEENGDFETALEAMKAKGLSKAAARSAREATAGIVTSYIHDGRIGVLIEVNCETEFVAKNEQFLGLVRDLALQIAACDPAYISPQDVPPSEATDPGHPPDLLSQAFIKDLKTTIGDLLQAKIAQLGENIVVSRFSRFELGNPEQRLVFAAERE